MKHDPLIDDKHAICELADIWFAATKTGGTQTIPNLMTDEVTTISPAELEVVIVDTERESLTRSYNRIY